MKTVKPSFEILYPTTEEQAIEEMRSIEWAGRGCYQSRDKITDTSYRGFIRRAIRKGHMSIIEHAIVKAELVIDRGVLQELARHRLVSLSVESTRYCNYSGEKFGGEITVIEPPGLTEPQKTAWYVAMLDAEEKYLLLLWLGCKPEIARSVLPNSLKANVATMTANAREWRHIFNLRTSIAAHPQIREVMLMGLKQMKTLFPPIFEDISRA